DEHMLEQAIRVDWPRLVGPAFSHRSRAGVLKRGALEVIVDSSVCLHEMKLRASDLLEVLRSRHRSVVSSLRSSLAVASATRPATPAERRKTPAPPLLPQETAWIDATIAPVATDRVLANSIRRLLAKDLTARARNPRQPSPTSGA